jgi:outer membrane biogenesis lipoprotein LolB
VETTTGQTLGIVNWDTSGAIFSESGKTRTYANLLQLSKAEFLGEAIPLADLFYWLNGQQGLAENWYLDAYDAELRRALIRRRAEGGRMAAELRIYWHE